MTASNFEKNQRRFVAGAVLFYAASAALPAMAAETDKNWKKAQISDYDTSLSLVEYQEVDETEAEKMQIATATGELATSGTVGSSAPDAAVSLATDLQPGEFGFTTYGYGHGCGLSQNGANFYATYGGYDLSGQSYSYYYPGTTLMQVDIPDSVTAGGRTGSVLDIISMLVYNEMGSNHGSRSNEGTGSCSIYLCDESKSKQQ